jgi:LysR family glycine cleavage system transcriptional activator
MDDQEFAMTSRLPSLNGLRAFEAAARHLSFTKAAAELNVTQTAISHQIRRLEEELGVALFLRQNRALALTGVAGDYLPAIRAAFQDLRLATERLHGRNSDRILTVSTLASFAAKWLLPRLSHFQELQPNIDVRITTSMELVDFQRDNVDAAIRYGRGQWPDVKSTWLMADELFPVCSPALLAGPNPLRGPQDIPHHVLLHTSGFSDDWRLWLTAAGMPVDAATRGGLTFDLSFMTVQAAIDGLGIAIGRTSYVQDDIVKGRLVVPFDVALPADAGFYLVAPPATAQTAKLAAFADWVVTEAGRTAPQPAPYPETFEKSGGRRSAKAAKASRASADFSRS